MIVFVILLLVSVLCWNHACPGSIGRKNSRPILRRYWYYGSQRKTVRFEKYFLGGFLVYQLVFTQSIFWRLSINVLESILPEIIFFQWYQQSFWPIFPPIFLNLMFIYLFIYFFSCIISKGKKHILKDSFLR